MNKKKFLAVGLLISVAYHLFILAPALRRVSVTRENWHPVHEDNIDIFLLEDVVIEQKKKSIKKKHKNIPDKLRIKKEKKKSTKKKKLHKKTEKHLEKIKAQNYKKVPFIDTKQKFTMKKNKKPKGSSKIVSGGSLPTKGNIRNEVPEKKAAFVSKGQKKSTKKQKEFFLKEDKTKYQGSTPVKKTKKNGKKQKREKALLSSSPILNEGKFISSSIPDILLKKKKTSSKQKKYSLWDIFNTKDFEDLKKKKKIDNMPKLSMIEPPKLKIPFLGESSFESKKLLRGDLFNLNELSGGGNSFGKGRNKGYNFGSLTIGDENFQNEWYARVLVSKVAHNWYPPSIAYLGASGVTVISFSITRSGKVINQTISKKSKSPPIDESASNAINLSDAFPPLPDDYIKEKLDIKFSFYVNVYPPSHTSKKHKN